ncbi:TPA: hypothetical protein ACT5CI_002895 [Edwardsiella tarda]
MFTWFLQQGMTSDEADRLVDEYQKRGFKARKSLNVDPRLWDVAAKLPESEYQPKTPRGMINPCWR